MLRRESGTWFEHLAVVHFVGTALSFDSPAKLDDSYFVRPDVKTLSWCEKLDFLPSPFDHICSDGGTSQCGQCPRTFTLKGWRVKNRVCTSERRCDPRPFLKRCFMKSVQETRVDTLPSFFRNVFFEYIFASTSWESQPSRFGLKSFPKNPQRPGGLHGRCLASIFTMQLRWLYFRYLQKRAVKISAGGNLQTTFSQKSP